MTQTSAIFQRPLLAKIVGFMSFYFLSVVPLPFVKLFMASLTMKQVVSILPQTAFFLGLEVFTRSEVCFAYQILQSAEIGITFDTIGSTKSYGYSVAYAYGIYVVDLVLYMLLALYLDNVLPTPGGMRKSWNFFFKSSYWCPKPPKPVEEMADGQQRLLEETKEPTISSDTSYEPVGPDLTFQESQNRTVKIRGLRKVFDGEKVAVDGLDMDMYTGQIFALLGHNGAGKTTTISMLTGMLLPTEGSATALGIDAFTELMTLRKDLGVCTQHDSHFEQLTVAEHLDFFGRIKGLKDAEIRADTERLLRDLRLEHEKTTLAKALSGGNKRKLSVALAFLGNPRFVLLDEPTSGMDTTTRRELWDILAGYKRDRILLLTTHYMDEADTLGDRIGIMAQGKLICCGSSMFLKKRYGIGYNLGIIKENSTVPTEDIVKFVSDRIDGVETGLVAGEEVELRLPFTESAKFKEMFTEMDSNLVSLGIKSYGISITTLEDVFIKVGEMGGEVSKEWQKKVKDTVEEEKIEKQNVYSLSENSKRSVCEQFGVIIKKKMKENVRNSSVLIFSIILPLILMWAGLSTFKAFYRPREHTYSISNDFPNSPILVNDETYLVTNNTVQPALLLSDFEKNTNAKLSFVHFEKYQPSWVTMKTFADYIDSHRPDSSFRYSSYFVYEADKEEHKYSILTFLNLTCPQSLFAFNGELASTLLSRVSGAKLTTTLGQMEVANAIKQMIYKSQQVGQFTGLFALGLGLVPGLIGSYLVHEYEKELKAHLLLAGLPLWIYWIAYYLIDVLNYYIPILCVVGLYNLMSISVFLLLANFLVAPIRMAVFSNVSIFSGCICVLDQPDVLAGVLSFRNKRCFPFSCGNVLADCGYGSTGSRKYGNDWNYVRSCICIDTKLFVRVGNIRDSQQVYV
eukprot:TRINITY_DN71102_c1_g1_i1.p1 TRINITY_DN71102_c1_g1~~TRINITY_DN71102_c1_g1_i1.p1  ORF type:complete len:910 (-),score=71.75 TRINITY_DN71102_c1_g1_i1:2772-5501(-)